MATAPADSHPRSWARVEIQRTGRSAPAYPQGTAERHPVLMLMQGLLEQQARPVTLVAQCIALSSAPAQQGVYNMTKHGTVCPVASESPAVNTHGRKRACRRLTRLALLTAFILGNPLFTSGSMAQDAAPERPAIAFKDALVVPPVGRGSHRRAPGEDRRRHVESPTGNREDHATRRRHAGVERGDRRRRRMAAT